MAFPKTLHTAESPYGRYRVVDMTYNGRAARVLFGTKDSPQSGAAKDDEPELLFDYNQRLLEMILSHQPKRLLIIGGGAFMLPTAAFYQFPKTVIDVVEIDPLLITIARDFFDLPDDPRLRIHAMDGAEFVAQSKDRYDMIIIDAFSGYTIPSVLIDENAAKHYTRHLKRSGVVAVNLISEYKPRHADLAHTLVDTFSKVYPEIALFPADPEYLSGVQQNLIFVAGRTVPSFDYLQSDALELLP